MNRAHNRLLCAVGLVVFAASCTSTRDQELAGRIAVAAETEIGDASVVTVSDLATFAWERLFIFSPYTPSSSVEKELGFAWSESDRMKERDDVVLLVFIDARRVVRFVDQPRRTGDFADCHRPGGFSRPEAVFRFTKDATGWRRCARGSGPS